MHQNFARNKINAVAMAISVLDSVEDIVKEGKTAGHQHFLLFAQCFKKAFFLKIVNPLLHRYSF